MLYALGHKAKTMIIELLKASGIKPDLFKTEELQRLIALRDLLIMECDGLLGATVTPHGPSGICIVTATGRYQIGWVGNIPEMVKQHRQYEGLAKGKLQCYWAGQRTNPRTGLDIDIYRVKKL